MRAYRNILYQAKITISYVQVRGSNKCKLAMPCTVLESKQGTSGAAAPCGRQNCFAVCAVLRIKLYDKA